MAFQKIKAPARYQSMATNDLVSIRADNRVYLSDELLAKHNIQRTKYIELFLDHKAMLLGLKFVETYEDGSYCAVGREYSGVNVNISNVLGMLRIIVPVAVRQKAMFKDGMIIVSLKDLDKGWVS
jgi:hypothetical protein